MGKNSKSDMYKRRRVLDCPQHGRIEGFVGEYSSPLFEKMDEHKTKVILCCSRCFKETLNKELKESHPQENKRSFTEKKKYPILENLFEVLGFILLFGGFIGCLFLFDNYILLFSWIVFIAILFGALYFLQSMIDEEVPKSDSIEKVDQVNPYSLISKYEAEVMKWRIEQKNKRQQEISYSLSDIDKMSGIEFESYIRKLLIKCGYEDVELTSASGDEGVDIIAKFKGDKIALQCKRYTGKISNSAVQQVFSGMHFYGCDKAVVITNSHFTENAKVLAKKLNVHLIDRIKLFELIQKAKEKDKLQVT
ncbi:restriction endonuclease [Halalkalibacter oceani]|uniref:restriction endonuclease n=1 Tax=Halalkalibacter oceani TaxID=1653776 RepID=UPI00339AD9BC